jgi:hypothetical protein
MKPFYKALARVAGWKLNTKRSIPLPIININYTPLKKELKK